MQEFGSNFQVKLTFKSVLIVLQEHLLYRVNIHAFTKFFYLLRGVQEKAVIVQRHCHITNANPPNVSCSLLITLLYILQNWHQEF